MFDCFFCLSALLFWRRYALFVSAGCLILKLWFLAMSGGFAGFCVIYGSVRIGRMSCPKLRLRGKRCLFEREKPSFFYRKRAQNRVNFSEMICSYKK